MATLNLRRGLNNTGLLAQFFANSPGALAWTNVAFGQTTPAGNDPIDLILKLLLSTGSGTNIPAVGTSYDQYEAGVGLGIALDQVDVTSFTAIQAHYDWDPNQQLFFHMTDPEPAKEFIDEELCRPFGLYLRTGNDGNIRCVRPRHPQKFYIGSVNYKLKVQYPAGGSATEVSLPIGVYDGPKMATLVESALNGPFSGFSCSYSAATHKFTLSKSDAFDVVTSSDNGWATLGWTTLPVNSVMSTTSQVERGQFSGSMISQDDMFQVSPIDNFDERITAVTYMFDYDVDAKTYRNTRRYTDPEYVGLDDTFGGAHDYNITSRGMISGGDYGASWVHGFKAPASGCTPATFRPSLGVGVNSDGWSLLFAKSLIDRYRQPPIKFSAKLKWKWNTLEVGDVVRVSYDIPGVFADYELNKDVLDNRLFEIVELHPNFSGTVDATFLGHRHVSY